MKVIHFGADSKAHRQIKHEVTALRSQRAPLLSDGFGADGLTLPCANISRFYGCVVDKAKKQASIAMEYESCGSLEDWMKEGLPAPEPWIAHVAHSILKVRRGFKFFTTSSPVHLIQLSEPCVTATSSGMLTLLALLCLCCVHLCLCFCFCYCSICACL